MSTVETNGMQCSEQNVKSMDQVDRLLERTDFDRSCVVVSRAYRSLEDGKVTLWTSVYEDEDDFQTGRFTVDSQDYGLEEGEIGVQKVEKSGTVEGLKQYGEEILGEAVDETPIAGLVGRLHERYQQRAEESEHLEEKSLEQFDRVLEQRLDSYNGIYSGTPALE